MPTIVLSNHPGHKRAIATHIPINTLEGMIDAIEANGWLGEVDAVMTGYMPSVEHVMLAKRTIEHVKNRRPDAMVLVDPIIGDDPKGLYVEERIAQALRGSLLPLASVITPNRFELSWLSGYDVRAPADAILAVRSGGLTCDVVATSVPDGSRHLATMAIGRASATLCRVERLKDVPHGTGDMLSGLYLGHRMAGRDAAATLACSVAGVATAIAGSVGQEELRLVATLDAAIQADPAETRPGPLPV